MLQLGTIRHRKLAGGRILGAARKRVADLSFKETEALQTAGGCSLATGSFWGLFTEDQPKQDMEAGGGFEDRGMKEEEKMRSNTGASLCLPSVLHSCCAQCLSNPTHHISGQKKMSFYLKLSFCESG